MGFSDFFLERDRAEFRESELRKDHDFRYLRIKDEQMKNKIRKDRIKEKRVLKEKEREENPVANNV